MKKSLLIAASILLTLASLNAKAEFYLGVDLIGSTAIFDSKKDPNSGADFTLNKDTDYTSSNIGGGLNLGYRFNAGQKFFIAPELSYEFLNARSHLNYNTSASSIDMQVESRAILKLNLGYKLSQTVEIFAFGGFGGAETQLTDIGLLGDSSVDSSSSGIFGVGTLLNLTKDWVIKIAYDYQSVKVQRTTTTGFISTYEVPETNIDIHTLRTGLMYKF
jgi:opacity protein-like surface antigen